MTSAKHNRLRALLVDDEDLARHALRELLKPHPEVSVVAECANGFEALKAAAEHQPDLVFLDVQMPKLTGFDVLELDRVAARSDFCDRLRRICDESVRSARGGLLAEAGGAGTLRSGAGARQEPDWREDSCGARTCRRGAVSRSSFWSGWW